VISGIHAILYSRQAESVQAFFRDVLELPFVDAGEGWPIFAGPPMELAVHPTAEEPEHELYLMCDDVHALTAKLAERGIEMTMPIADRGWGLVTSLRLADGEEIGLYQPKHPSPIQHDGARASEN
jgi:predicted enzyme related to lactoylglutathione lyase